MGAFDHIKGKAKEAVGSVTGSDDLRREGQAQQLKAEEERLSRKARLEADRHERLAEEHERRAEAHERAERGHQGGAERGHQGGAEGGHQGS